MSKSSRGNLTALMVAAFVDMMGLLMVVPLFPFVATALGGGGFVVGALVSSYSLAQLLSAPLWGRLSDRHGRRPVLLTALTASAIAYLIFAWASVPPSGDRSAKLFYLGLLFVSRIVQGAGGGTVGVIQAYVADSTEPRDRARALGWLSAATNLGVSIGPALGSVSQRIGPRAPGFVAAVICLVNMGFVWRWVRESHVVERHPQTGAAPRPVVTSREATMRVMTHPAEPASRLIWIYAIGMGAFFGFNAILALFLAKRFGATAQNVGFFFTWVGSISVIVRAFLLGPAVDRFGEVRLSRIGLALLGLGFVLLPFTNYVHHGGGPHVAFHPAIRWLHWAAFDLALEPRIVVLALVIALFPLGTAFTFPCVTGLLSQVIDQRERGVMMGVQQSYGGAARVLFPLLSGWTYEHLGTDYPSWTSAILVAGTFMLSFGIRQPRDEPVAAGPAPARTDAPSAEPEEPPAVAAR